MSLVGWLREEGREEVLMSDDLASMDMLDV